MRNKAARAVSGHEAECERWREKFNELEHESPPSLGRSSVVLPCDENATSHWTSLGVTLEPCPNLPANMIGEGRNLTD